jgi:signal transduction histidine kinase
MDGEKIRKVLTNLLVNATEAVQPGGEVRVTSGEWGPYIRLVVADNGCGMDRNYMAKRLFRPFQTTKKKGIGIGLFLSKRIIEAHGGLIKVESALGKGTAFTLLLPRQEPEI